jgi:hypothetical protein
MQIRREFSPPLKIPLQPKRIKSHPIRRIRRLKNQIRRHRVHRIFKSPAQNPRPMRPRNHPPISQPRIKNSRVRRPSRHRVPAPGPHLHLPPILLRTRLLRSTPPRAPHHQPNRQRKNRQSKKKEGRSQGIKLFRNRHRPTRLPHPHSFCKCASSEWAQFAERHWIVGGILTSLLWFFAGKQSLSNGRAHAAIFWQGMGMIIVLILSGWAFAERQWLALPFAIAVLWLEARSIRRIYAAQDRQR